MAWTGHLASDVGAPNLRDAEPGPTSPTVLSATGIGAVASLTSRDSRQFLAPRGLAVARFGMVLPGGTRVPSRSDTPSPYLPARRNPRPEGSPMRPSGRSANARTRRFWIGANSTPPCSWPGWPAPCSSVSRAIRCSTRSPLRRGERTPETTIPGSTTCAGLGGRWARLTRREILKLIPAAGCRETARPSSCGEDELELAVCGVVNRCSIPDPLGSRRRPRTSRIHRSGLTTSPSSRYDPPWLGRRPRPKPVSEPSRGRHQDGAPHGKA
jgi:hypothetical protein